MAVSINHANQGGLVTMMLPLVSAHAYDDEYLGWLSAHFRHYIYTHDIFIFL